jgi:hypothetical protein
MNTPGIKGYGHGPYWGENLKPSWESEMNIDEYESHVRKLVAAEARIRELEAAIVKFWDYAKLVLPMPVHPAVGAIMRIGRDLESQSDRQGDHDASRLR